MGIKQLQIVTNAKPKKPVMLVCPNGLVQRLFRREKVVAARKKASTSMFVYVLGVVAASPHAVRGESRPPTRKGRPLGYRAIQTLVGGT